MTAYTALIFGLVTVWWFAATICGAIAVLAYSQRGQV